MEKAAILWGLLKLILKIAAYVEANGGVAKLKEVEDVFDAWTTAKTPAEMQEAARKRAELGRTL